MSKQKALQKSLKRAHNIIISALRHGITETWEKDAKDVLMRDHVSLNSYSSGRDSECAFTANGKAPWDCKYVYDPSARRR